MQRPGKVGQCGRFMGVLVEKLPDLLLARRRLPPFGLPRTLKSPENPLPDQRQQPGKVGDALFIRRRQSGMGSLKAGRRCAGSAKCTGVEDQHRRAAAFDRHDKFRHPLPAMMQKRTQFAEGGRFGLKRALRQAGAIPLGNGVASGPAIRMRVMVAPGQERLAVRIEQQRTVVVNGDRDAEQPFRRIDRLRQITSGAARVKFIQEYRFQHDSVNIQQNAPLSNCRFRGILWKIQRRRYEYCAQGV